MTPSDPALAAHLPKLRRRTVLVLGDVMLDRYVTGEVRRISPEAPIPVLHATSRRTVLGGAGNVAQNVAALGGRALLCGLVGRDDAGEEIQHLLAASPHAADGSVAARLVRTGDRPTTVKTRFVSGAHQLLRLDEEADHPAPPELETRVLETFAAILPEAEAVVISDYAKGLLTDRVLAGVLDLARQAGVPVVVDPKRADFAAYAGATVLTPNAAELAHASGLPVATDAEVEAAGRAVLERVACSALLVTRSEKGMTLLRPAGAEAGVGAAVLHIPTRAREVSDVSGAGDTVIATLATLLAAGVALPEAAALANVAAGVAVAKPGTAAVSMEELAEALHQRAQASLDGKIVSLEAARERVAAWHREGLRVGFTNGCFDLIHPGHARLLARARAACDRLVVGLNSDASVRRLKGPTRPVQNEQARATVMASMASADLVVVFGEDTPEALIGALLPDLLFKGADYTREQVVGGDIVEAHGGRVELIELEAGQSTTATIRRIGEGAGV